MRSIELLGAHDEQLGHAVRAARNQGQHRERREARRLAEHDDVARPALERQQRERHQGHEQELLVDVPACGRGSCSRHAAMACSGMDVASMASGATHTPSPRRSRSVSRRRREGKARQGTRAPTKAEGRERRVRRAGVGQAPRRRGVGRARRGVDRRQAREDRQERAGLRAGRGQHLDGRLHQAARRAGARAPPQHLQQDAVREDIQSPDVRRPVAVHEAARVEGEEAARELRESGPRRPARQAGTNKGAKPKASAAMDAPASSRNAFTKSWRGRTWAATKTAAEDRRERQKQMLRAARARANSAPALTWSPRLSMKSA